MTAAPVLLMHDSSLSHDTGAHPERADRIVAIERELEAHGWIGYRRGRSVQAPVDALTAVHTPAHVEMVRAMAEAGGGPIDADTSVSAGSYTAALHAAGGAIELVDLLLDGAAPTGFSVHRPPGHHATRSQAMGFCLFNNVAVAARWALDRRGLERVMIVDYDVHHGNGTNDIFAADPRVLFVSIHQSPLYPGTGAASDVGIGAGAGFNVNLPVAPASGDELFVGLVAAVAVPLARCFEPQLVLVSAGFDAHVDDPLAGCTVTEQGFAQMTALVRDAASAVGAPVGGVLEGGYGLPGLARSVRASMEALAGPPRPLGSLAGPAFTPSPAVASARARVAAHWPALTDR